MDAPQWAGLPRQCGADRRPARQSPVLWRALVGCHQCSNRRPTATVQLPAIRAERHCVQQMQGTSCMVLPSGALALPSAQGPACRSAERPQRLLLRGSAAAQTGGRAWPGGPGARHWPCDRGCPKSAQESRIDRNWRVFMTVANSSAPYARIVCMMNSWPARPVRVRQVQRASQQGRSHAPADQQRPGCKGADLRCENMYMLWVWKQLMSEQRERECAWPAVRTQGVALR